jgi:hypothetical protein
MPQVADISDSVEEDLQSPADEALSLPLTAPPEEPKWSLLAYLRGLISPTRRARGQRHSALRIHDFERPVDTLARQHPYLFIKAMSS